MKTSQLCFWRKAGCLLVTTQVKCLVADEYCRWHRRLPGHSLRPWPGQEVLGSVVGSSEAHSLTHVRHALFPVFHPLLELEDAQGLAHSLTHVTHLLFPIFIHFWSWSMPRDWLVVWLMLRICCFPFSSTFGAGACPGTQAHSLTHVTHLLFPVSSTFGAGACPVTGSYFDPCYAFAFTLFHPLLELEFSGTGWYSLAHISHLQFLCFIPVLFFGNKIRTEAPEECHM